MKNNAAVMTSLCWSILLHALFLGVSVYLAVPSSLFLEKPLEKMFKVKTVVREVPKRVSKDLEKSYVEKIKFEKPDEQTQKLLSKLAPLKKAMPLPETFEATQSQETLRSPDTIAHPYLDPQLLKEHMDIKKRKVVYKDTTVELDVVGTWQAMVEGELGDAAVKSDAHKMTAFTPVLSAMTPELSQGFDRSRVAVDVEILPVPEARARYESLDEFLQVKVETYRDPAEEQGFYRISISPGKNADQFTIIPKEVVFLVDASLSIQTKRLKGFKRGIETVLQNLNNDDRFNIITFKEDISSLAAQSQPANPLSINQALNFLDDLRASQRTDLYQAFLDSLQIKESLLPSYIILLSDGRPNSGIVSPIDIISEITQVNARKRSIFTFSGGEKINRYLLDYLAYQNRGWSEYAKNVNELDEQLAALYQKIRNPILTDVRFQITPLDIGEVYPKHLPDFYRDTQFVIYGRFAEARKFSFRVLGNIGDKIKELVYTHDLSEVDQGGEEIAQNWAYNKVYHLMGQMALEGQDAETLREIQSIQKKFKL